VGIPGRAAYVNLLASERRTRDRREDQVTAVAHRGRAVPGAQLVIINVANGTVLRRCGVQRECSVLVSSSLVADTLVGELVEGKTDRLDAISAPVSVP